MGVRTAFNLLGPLTNPAGATRQVVGVPRPDLTRPARALAAACSSRLAPGSMHGADGIDEISTTGHTKVSECRDGAVHTFYIHPSEFGIRKATLAELLGGDAGRERRDRPTCPGSGRPGAPARCRRAQRGRRRCLSPSRVASVARGHHVSPRRPSTQAPHARRSRSMVRASQAEAVA